MTTKQTDAVAMTEQQLDAVVGGAALGDIKGEHVQGGVLRMDKSSTRMRFRGCVPTDPD